MNKIESTKSSRYPSFRISLWIYYIDPYFTWKEKNFRQQIQFDSFDGHIHGYFHLDKEKRGRESYKTFKKLGVSYVGWVWKKKKFILRSFTIWSVLLENLKK